MFEKKFKNNLFYFLFLFLFGISVNNYYGFIGVNPIDNFMIFSSANLILEGNLPFKDFWLTYGLFPNIMQSVFFKFLGVNWKSYVFHASILNAIMTVSLFKIFLMYELDLKKSFFYSLIFSIIFYPVVGTPFVDQYSVFFSFLAVFSFLAALKNNNYFFWSLIPLFLILGFLSKQTPTAYIGIVLFFFSIFLFFKNKNYQLLYAYICSGLLVIGVILFFFYYNEINLNNFFIQYISFPSEVGSGRINSGSFLEPFSFSRYFIKFKYINTLNSIILFSFFYAVYSKKIVKNPNKYIASILIVFCSFAMIIHQQLTLNSKYIFFLIPILSGFAHIVCDQYLFSKKKLLFSFIFLLSTFSSIYYYYYYVHNRSFLILNQNFKKDKIFKTNIIDNSKNDFNWITHYDQSPELEIKKLKEAIQEIKIFENNYHKKYIIITDYQFIRSSFNLKNSMVFSQLYASGITYPHKESKYFNYYKNFFLNKIRENHIDTIFFILPTSFQEENYALDGIVNLECAKKKYYKNVIKIDNVLKCFL